MLARSHTAARRLRSADGFTVIELLAAILVLTVGLLGLVGGFNTARKLTLLSERRTSMSHRAQLELERLQAIPYKELGMSSAPSHSSVTTNPDYRVKEGTPAKYQYGTSATEEETIVESSSDSVSSSPSGRKCSKEIGSCEWEDGLVSGSVYDFVTWYGESSTPCTKHEEPCPKRITVVVTAKVPSGTKEVAPVHVSTLID
jgi:Tfp pilus assembly protein PilV